MRITIQTLDTDTANSVADYMSQFNAHTEGNNVYIAEYNVNDLYSVYDAFEYLNNPELQLMIKNDDRELVIKSRSDIDYYLQTTGASTPDFTQTWRTSFFQRQQTSWKDNSPFVSYAISNPDVMGYMSEIDDASIISFVKDGLDTVADKASKGIEKIKDSARKALTDREVEKLFKDASKSKEAYDDARTYFNNHKDDIKFANKYRTILAKAKEKMDGK